MKSQDHRIGSSLFLVRLWQPERDDAQAEWACRICQLSAGSSILASSIIGYARRRDRWPIAAGLFTLFVSNLHGLHLLCIVACALWRGAVGEEGITHNLGSLAPGDIVVGTEGAI